MKRIQESEISGTYLDFLDKNNGRDGVIIAGTNKSVQSYNQAIRAKIFPSEDTIKPEDKILVVRNNYKYSVLNGEFGIIKEILTDREEINVKLRKTNEEIVLDGEMNENFWKEAEAKSNFFQTSPRDSIPAILDTEFRIAYDDKFLYLLAKMEDIPEKKFMVGDLKRDFFGGSIDYTAFMFDTFMDETNAFNFALSPFGIQREAMV